MKKSIVLDEISNFEPPPKKKRGRKQKVTDDQIFHALSSSNGFQTHAAKMLSITPQSLSKRIQLNVGLIELVAGLRKKMVDDAAATIWNLVKQDSFKAAKFVLQSFGSEDGWVKTSQPFVSSDVKIFLPEKRQIDDDE